MFGAVRYKKAQNQSKAKQSHSKSAYIQETKGNCMLGTHNNAKHKQSSVRYLLISLFFFMFWVSKCKPMEVCSNCKVNIRNINIVFNVAKPNSQAMFVINTVPIKPGS